MVYLVKQTIQFDVKTIYDIFCGFEPIHDLHKDWIPTHLDIYASRLYSALRAIHLYHIFYIYFGDKYMCTVRGQWKSDLITNIGQIKQHVIINNRIEIHTKSKRKNNSNSNEFCSKSQWSTFPFTWTIQHTTKIQLSFYGFFGTKNCPKILYLFRWRNQFQINFDLIEVVQNPEILKLKMSMIVIHFVSRMSRIDKYK